ncbi:hypothetical protein [Clostridium sp. CCUG 7971]|uniref:hypothetical protein n=1 Tax=Clostridium sp. CCUG 7971 TaxID=2811414 RepID=UPI001ABADE14|nr:hypothetical protein [Clostridium sp. CCUG 7971]MBO3445857.1 hypothetical protein [Clostridium sp. CCUG 7971]
MKDIIEKDVDIFLEILEYYKNFSSILINEILLESSFELPEQYANNIISWICVNEGIHLLNRSGENKDELYHTKQIISKFSPYCSEDEFIKLEGFIYNYRDKDDVDTLKRRIDTNSKGNEYHVYWHYWGEIQYSLLPYICKEKLSIKSKNLIPVLERRFKNVYLRHQKSESHGGFVSSTISPKAHLFSDKTWVKIIANKNVEKRRNSKWIETKGGFYESTVDQFASTFGKVAEKNPTRFAKLALSLPDNTDILYINQVFKLIGLNECPNIDVKESNWEPITIETSELIINKFEYALSDSYCAKTLCTSIKNRSKENWSISILEKISKLAIEHPHPGENEIIVWNEDDKEMKTFNMLWSSSINCVRGSAAETIGSILWERKELLKMFRSAVNSLVVDKNPSVRLSAINCLSPIYNIDRTMSENLTMSVLNNDFRIATHPYSRQLVYLMYKRYKDELNNIIEKMFFSEDKDVCKEGAYFIANFYIRYGELRNLLYSKSKLNDSQKYSIILCAINLFDIEEYKDKCNEILTLFLDEDNENGDLYNRLFWDKKIDIIRDKDLLHKMLKQKVSKKVINYFIKYLEDSDKGVLEFSEVVFELCKSIIVNLKKQSSTLEYKLYGVEGSISNLLMSLYEKSIGTDEVNEKCLDILDLMFENGIGNLRRKLSDAIIDY